MHTTVLVLLLFLLPSLVTASPPPIYPGFRLLWSDGFEGKPGETPNRRKWNLITE